VRILCLHTVIAHKGLRIVKELVVKRVLVGAEGEALAEVIGHLRLLLRIWLMLLLVTGSVEILIGLVCRLFPLLPFLPPLLFLLVVLSLLGPSHIFSVFTRSKHHLIVALI